MASIPFDTDLLSRRGRLGNGGADKKGRKEEKPLRESELARGIGVSFLAIKGGSGLYDGGQYFCLNNCFLISGVSAYRQNHAT